MPPRARANVPWAYSWNVPPRSPLVSSVASAASRSLAAPGSVLRTKRSPNAASTSNGTTTHSTMRPACRAFFFGDGAPGYQPGGGAGYPPAGDGAGGKPVGGGGG